MGRMRSIGEKGPEETVMSRRVAAEVGRQLRYAGWPVTQRALWGSTPRAVALKLAPWGDSGQKARLALTICEMAGFMPALGEQP